MLEAVTVPIDTNPGHTREIPQAWPEFLNLSNELAADCPGGFTREAGLQLRHEMGKLPDETLEDLRYFSLTELAAVLGPGLQDSKTHEAVVEGAVKGIAEYRFNDNRNTLPSNRLYGRMYRIELDSHPVASGIKGIVDQLVSPLPLGMRQLADALREERMYRRECYGGVAKPLNEYDTEALLGSGSAVKSIATNMFSSAIDLFDIRIESALPEGRKDEDCVISDVIDLENLNVFDLVVTGGHAAGRLHIDEVKRWGFRRYIRTSDETGKIEFRRGFVLGKPDRIPAAKPDDDAPDVDGVLWSNRALHDKVKRCPALHVRQLISQVVQMVPEIVLVFDKQNSIV